ncbi:MAG: tRNA isopentenyl-2-thiomethyl-A-37 hydroxylase MiaE [Acidobacteriota bacterium]
MPKTIDPASIPTEDELRDELPLLSFTPAAWADLAAADLPTFLADHAVCEQQAALFGLSLIGHYPNDVELVEQMGMLAAEEVSHLRRVVTILRKREWPMSKKRPNPWVSGLRQNIESDRGPYLKVDRLFVGALIEARSCERFTCLLRRIHDADPEVGALLVDLGPAEKRHWRMFYRLAERELPVDELTERWRGWLELERDLSTRGGVQPTVHG